MSKRCECYSPTTGHNPTCGSCGGSGVPGNTRVKQLEALRVANIENENALLNRIAELEAMVQSWKKLAEMREETAKRYLGQVEALQARNNELEAELQTLRLDMLANMPIDEMK